MTSILYGLTSRFEVSLPRENRFLEGNGKSKEYRSKWRLFVMAYILPEIYFCDKSILTVRTSLDCLQVFSSVEGKGWNLESNWR